LHHRIQWLGDSDPFGELVAGCRKLGMVVIARTDRTPRTMTCATRIRIDRVEAMATGGVTGPRQDVVTAPWVLTTSSHAEVKKEIMSRVSSGWHFHQIVGGSGIVTASTA